MVLDPNPQNISERGSCCSTDGTMECCSSIGGQARGGDGGAGVIMTGRWRLLAIWDAGRRLSTETLDGHYNTRGLVMERDMV